MLSTIISVLAPAQYIKVYNSQLIYEGLAYLFTLSTKNLDDYKVEYMFTNSTEDIIFIHIIEKE